MNDTRLVGVVPESVVILAVEPCATEIGRGGNGRASFAALDDCDVEMGTGDFVSPPFGIEKSRLLYSGRGGE